MTRILCPLLLLLLLFGCDQGNITVTDTDKFLPSIERGDKVINTLESYFQENGNYPKTLNDLVPGFISEVPKVGVFDNDFFYLNYRSYAEENNRTYNGPDRFTLSFRLCKPSFFDLGAKARTSFVYRTEEKYGSEKEDVHFKFGKWAYITQHRHKIGEGGRVK